MITKMFQKIEGYGWGMEKKKEKIFKKPRHEVTLVAQWRQMPHIKNDDQFSQRSFFLSQNWRTWPRAIKLLILVSFFSF